MKKLFPQLLILLFISISSYAQNIKFTDAKFKRALVNHKDPIVDTNKDGEISIAEAKKVTRLDLDRWDITSLKEIHFFTNLTTLSCNRNNLKYLDVSKNSNLKHLSCTNNNISKIKLYNKNLISLYCGLNILNSLDVSNSPKLEELDTHKFSETGAFNNIKKLDLSKNPHIKTLDCAGSGIETLNITENKKLTSLNCSYNKLYNLDISNNTNLEELNCTYIYAKKLDVTKNKKLISLVCDRNPLRTLNLVNNTNLKVLNFSHNKEITFLDLRNCKLNSLKVQNCPELKTLLLTNQKPKQLENGNFFEMLAGSISKLDFICLDKKYIKLLKAKLPHFSDRQISSTCSVNILKGKVTYANDVSKCNIKNKPYYDLKFMLTGNGFRQFAPSESGEYELAVGKGSYKLIPILTNPSYFNITPKITFNSPPINFKEEGKTVIKNFCVTPSKEAKDLAITMISSEAVAGFNTTYKIIYRNKGTVTQSGSVVLNYILNKHQYISSSEETSGSTNSGEVTWDFSDLKPMEERIINVTFKINSPTDIPPVNIGDELCYSVNIKNIENTDVTPKDNTFKMCKKALSSWDPNDKVCLQGSILEPKNVGEYLHYMIRFENKGNANARKVKIVDLIDTSKFDIKSLIPLHGSHSFTTDITDNKVLFIFNNINLPFDDANNDGYVVFKIKTLPTLKEGDVIKNKASIFFDFNLPVITDEFITTVKKRVIKEPKFEDYFTLSPNPTTDIINLTEKKSGLKIKFITIYDVGDNMVGYFEGNERTIDISYLYNNLYFCNLHTEKYGILTKKFVKVEKK